MGKSRLWRGGLIAILALAFCATLTFGVLNAVPVNAAEELVFTGNTAKYTFENDPAENALWTYNRTNNEWTSSKNLPVNSWPIDYTKSNKLTLKVTTAGDIKFKWKVSNSSMAAAVRYYKGVPESGSLDGLEPTYVVNVGQHYQDSSYYKEGGDDSKNIVLSDQNYQRDIYCYDSREEVKNISSKYQDPVTIENCAVGDVIIFETIAQQPSSRYYFVVQGLNYPKNPLFSVTAEIAEGEDTLGKIHAEREGETDPTTEKLTVQRCYDESITFTAVPNDKAVAAYWTDSEGKKLTATNELKVTGIAEKDDNTKYIAHFVTEEDMKPTSSAADDGTQHWDIDEDGKATLNLKGEADNGDKNLSFGFVIPEGGAYLEIDYTYWTAKDLNSTNLYIDEIEQKGGTAQPLLGYSSSYAATFFMVRTHNDGKGERPTAKYLQWIGAPGYFTARLRIVKGSYGYTYTEGDEFSVNSIKVIKTPTEYQDLTFDFDSDLTTMTMKIYKGDRNSFEETPITANEPVKVPVGLTNITFSATQKGDTKASKYDNTKTVKYYTNVFSGAGEGFTKTTMIRDTPRTETWEDVSRNLGTSKYCYITIFNGSTITFSNGMTSTPVSGGGSHLPYTFKEAKIKVIYAEEVPISLTATAMTDGEPTEKKVKEGGFIGVPFGHTNSITLSIRKFANLTQEDLSIYVDGEEKKGDIQELENAFLFPLQISGTHNIEISYLKADDNENLYSKLKLAFSVGETVEGTIDDLIDHTPEETAGSVEITNDEQNAWTFDPVLSSAEEYVFTSIMDMEKSSTGSSYNGRRAVSSLTFMMTGAVSGGLSFEFRSEGYFQESGIFWKALRVGQLWYRSGSEFTSAENTTVGVQNGDIWTETLDNATWLSRPKAEKDGGMEFASSAVALEDGWYQVSIPIQENTPLYLGFLVCGYDSSGKLGYPEPSRCRASIRNVRLATGNKTATLKIGEDANEGSSATATVSDTQHTATKEGKEVTVTAGSLVKLSAKLGGNDQFYGWSVNGQLVSMETEANVFVNDDSTIVAWIAPEGTYNARADGTFYKTVKQAADRAQFGQTIYLLKDNLELTESFTIQESVTLLLPYSDENLLTATGTLNRISWIADSTKYRKFTVTVKSGVTITVQGTLAVGGVTNCVGQGYQGHTSGDYAEIILETGSKIQVAKGGVMDVYGRVWGGDGATDMGTIDVAEGGKLYEPFLILDFSGGTNAAGAFLAENPTTPFKRYAMINIEVPMTINYGGELLGHASLYALNQFFSLDQAFVSTKKDGQNDTFVMLTKGSKVTITYDPKQIVNSTDYANCTEGIGKIKMVFEGGATFSYMLFSAMGISVPTNSVYFSIPYNYEVEMNDFAAPQGDVHAQYETKTDFMIMPGAKVTVGKGATLTLNANAWVYDGLVQKALSGKSYPTAANLEAAHYSKSGNFIVNGTLKIGKKTTVEKFDIFASEEPFVPQVIGATFLGIIQTNGTGSIEIPADATLQGKIFDGVAGYNYFAYETTARVWDSVHSCFGDLKAGQTYTAVLDVEFTLNELTYSTTEGGETAKLTLNSKMVGAWKLEHTEHHFEFKDTTFADVEKYKEERGLCTELGCDAPVVILNMDGFALSATYKGADFTAVDLEALLKEYFFGGNDLPVGFGWELVLGNSATQNVGDYGFTLKLTGGFFSDGKTSQSLTFTVKAFDLGDLTEAEKQAVVKEHLSGFVYDGTNHQKEFTVTGSGFKGYAQFTADWTNAVNAGDAFVTLTGTDNFTGQVELKFEIEQKTIDLDLIHQTAAYSGNQPTVDSEKFSTNDILEKDKASVQITLKFVSEDGPWDVGSYNLTAVLAEGVDANKNYKIGTVSNATNAFEITKKDVTVTVDTQHKTYSGQALSYDGTWTADGLVEGEGNSVLGVVLSATGTDANSYDVTASFRSTNYTVTFKGAVEGKIKGAFVIDPKDATDANVAVNSTYTYNGTEQTVSVIVTLDGFDSLVLDRDFTIEYAKDADRVNAGTVNFTVKFKGNFSGSAEKTFTIGRATLTITPVAKYSPKGQEIVPLTATVTGLIEKDKDAFAAAESTIYALVCEATNEAEGTFPITVNILQGTWENYTVTAAQGTVNYTVTADVFKDVKFALAQTGVYNGEAHTATVTLPESAEGTFSYTAAVEDGAQVVNVGEYTITVTVTYKVNGTDEQYTQNYTVTYTVTPKDITAEGTDIDITLEGYEYTYTGMQITPGVDTMTADGLTVTEEEIELDYSNNVNVSTDGAKAIVTVTVKGNFSGTATAEFTIVPRSLEEAVAVLEEGTYGYNGQAHTPDASVTLRIGERMVTLQRGEDFDLTYTNNQNAGQATVTVVGMGNYTGSPKSPLHFTIAAKEISVTVNDQQLVYTGEAPQLDQSKWTPQQGAVVGTDDLKVTLTAESKGEKWNVGTYTIKGKADNGNYIVNFTDGTLTIGKKAITVTIEDKTSVYGATYRELTFTVEDGTLGKGDTKEDLHVTLSLSGSETRLTVGQYPITGRADESNYTVSFTGTKGTQGTYTVTKKKIAISIEDKTKVYDGKEPVLTSIEGADWKAADGAIEAGDELHVVLRKEEGTDVRAQGYAITGTFTNENYEVEWTNGAYTVTARPVTVTIEDQEDTYHYEHKYAFDTAKWQVDEDTLAEGETREDLNVTLKATLGDAGTYAIEGSWENGNYSVTFVGGYEKEGDPLSGKAGIYTVNKRDVSSDAIFIMTVTGSDDFTTEGARTVKVRYVGEALTLLCGVTYREGEKSKSLASVLSESTLNATGEYTITVTVEDPNYFGSTEFTIVVTNADGYTKELQEKLDTLSSLAAGKDKNALTAEDFADLKAIAGLLAGLTDEEKEVAADRLTEYSDLVAAWNALADIDSIVETAEKIADSPIEALFAAAAALTALAGLAYIALKGGIL